VDLRALNRATLARQLLLQRAALAPDVAVERLAGMQAQVARPPFIGLWTRLATFRREQLCEALLAKRVVRVTAMRRTLHLLSAADFVALRASLQPMLSAGMQSILRDRAASIDVAKLTAFAATKLPATFDVLRPLLAKKFPRSDERALGYAVRTTLPLVQVPTADDRWAFPASAQFAAADAWLGRSIATDADDATPHALVRRYLAAFGPATVKDAQTWSGFRDLRPAFDALRPELVTFRDGVRELFDLPDAPRPSADTDAPVRFLPDFDNLVLAHDDRRRIVSDEHRGQLVTKNLQVKATFLVDGFVAGTWKIERKKADAALVLSPFATLKKPVRAALDDEASALLRFVEDDATKFAVKLG
jgi:winged helix DNA-binding protein